MQQLQQHEQEMEGSDVLEVLLSFGDFSTFKDIMLSYKTEMAGSAFRVDVRSSVLHIPHVCSLLSFIWTSENVSQQTVQLSRVLHLHFFASVVLFFPLILFIRWG